MTFFRTIRNALAALMTAEGRRAWALVLLAGGAAMMTIYSGFAMYLVKGRSDFVFYLGLAAHFTILVAITGFAGLLVKRSIVAEFGEGRRLEFTDQANAAAAVAADTVAGAAADAAEQVKETS